jgi:protein tyrosine/serine phosphatase
MVIVITLFPVMPDRLLHAFAFESVIRYGTLLSGHPRDSIGAAAILPDSAHISERIFGLPGLRNVGRVSDAVYRGAQPEPEGYATLKKMGVRTVISIRKQSEKKEVEAAGMDSVEIPVNPFGPLESDTIKKIIAVMTDPSRQPVFLHCRRGKDRTGAIIAAYRIEIDGWSFEEAEAEMKAFGFSRIYYNLKKALRGYAEGLKKQ